VLRGQADEVVVLYANPNIHPLEEYERRRDTLMGYADEEGIKVVELPYQPELWERDVAPFADQGAARCRACYALRLGMAARYASEQCFDALATTLSVSPYQDHAGIMQAGTTASAEVGIRWLDRDFRDRYSRATRRSRELEMYRQNYCGCRFSRAEAAEQREARRVAKRSSDAALDWR
jgi:predicted adenine nucleotide alpha hydrolase (AANH) superfamily ATPase